MNFLAYLNLGLGIFDSLVFLNTGDILFLLVGLVCFAGAYAARRVKASQKAL